MAQTTITTDTGLPKPAKIGWARMLAWFRKYGWLDGPAGGQRHLGNLGAYG